MGATGPSSSAWATTNAKIFGAAPDTTSGVESISTPKVPNAMAYIETFAADATATFENVEQVRLFAFTDMARSFRGSLRPEAPSLKRKDAPAVLMAHRSRILSGEDLAKAPEHRLDK
jgi:hypothetical protein